MRAWLLGDWHLKLLALAVALGVWVFVVGSERRQVSMTAPVEYVGVPPRLMLVSDLAQRVELQLEATRWASRRLTADSLRVRLNLAPLGEGETLVPISPAEVETPPGVRVTRVTPPWVRVSLSAIFERSLPVVPRVRGRPAPGFAVARVTAEPSTVALRGPRTTIEKRERVETAPVDISGSRASVTQSVGLLMPEPAVSPLGSHSVHVTVEIEPEERMRDRGGR